MDYSEEEIKDIKERVARAQVYLKELNLYPAAVVQKVAIGDDKFVDQIICYLQDSKFEKKGPTPSPFNK